MGTIMRVMIKTVLMTVYYDGLACDGRDKSMESGNRARRQKRSATEVARASRKDEID